MSQNNQKSNENDQIPPHDNIEMQVPYNQTKPHNDKHYNTDKQPDPPGNETNQMWSNHGDDSKKTTKPDTTDKNPGNSRKKKMNNNKDEEMMDDASSNHNQTGYKCHSK